MKIREFTSEDAAQVTGCITQLQEFERGLDTRVLPGRAVEDWYLDYLLAACAQTAGRVLVAEVDGEVVGFAAVQARVPNEDRDEEGYEYAYISDLGVRETHRGGGIGRALIEAAEDYARARGARWLRIGVLARNETAHRLYRRCGFADRLVMLEKVL